MLVDIWIWGLVSLPLAILLRLHRGYSSIVSLVLRDRALATLWNDLRSAETFEEWEAAGLALDRHYHIDDTWRKVDKSSSYAWELVSDRLAAFTQALQAGHVQALVHLLQSGLVRNLGNITVPALYNASFAGTKYLIENYILQVCEVIHALVVLPGPDDAPAAAPGGEPPLLDRRPVADELARAVARAHKGGSPPPLLLRRSQKLQLCSNMRQSFGRTSLVLQGGSIFGLYHLGVARALFLRGLLPRIITGTGTGALIAALLCTHTDAHLLRVLDGESINLSAFARSRSSSSGSSSGGSSAAAVAKQRDDAAAAAALLAASASRWATLRRRVARFWNEGYFLDAGVLEQCVRNNGGDLTFEEAFQRTGRTLNIMVVTGNSGDVPHVLNYVTAPNVLIWTAAVASNVTSSSASASASSSRRHHWRGDGGGGYEVLPTAILCKDETGRVVPWPLAGASTHFQHWTVGTGVLASSMATMATTRDAPLQRVAQLFNVNHFVVSQARPYLVPFLEPSMHSPAMHGMALGTLVRAQTFVLRQTGHFVRHRLDQLVRLGWLPLALRRLLLDEQIPGNGVGDGNSQDSDRLVLVPSVTLRDYLRLLDAPTPAALHYWLRKGEQAVWPAVAALKIRCSVELALEQACADLGAPAAVPQPADDGLGAASSRYKTDITNGSSSVSGSGSGSGIGQYTSPSTA